MEQNYPIENILTFISNKKCSICGLIARYNIPVFKFSTCLDSQQEKLLGYKFHHYFCSHCAFAYTKYLTGNRCLECKQPFSSHESQFITKLSGYTLHFNMVFFINHVQIIKPLDNYTKWCIICMAHCDASSMLIPSHNNKHSVCISCIQKYINSLIENKKASWCDIECPYSRKSKSCKKKLTQHELMDYIDKTSISLLELNFNQQHVTKCNNCSCIGTHALVPTFECSQCHQNICTKCGSQLCQCIQEAEKQEKAELISLLNAFECPFCHRLIDKIDGCFDMVCICKGSFCGACLAPLEPINVHGQHYHRKHCTLFIPSTESTKYSEKCSFCRQLGKQCKNPSEQLS